MQIVQRGRLFSLPLILINTNNVFHMRDQLLNMKCGKIITVIIVFAIISGIVVILIHFIWIKITEYIRCFTSIS